MNQSGDMTTNDRLLMALGGNDSSATDVLSTQTINANKLWDQVNGEFEVKRDNGTEFIITFSEARARERIG